MITRTQPSTQKAAASFLILAGAGIVVQILGGADYPPIPPGLVILLVAAALMWFVSKTWAVAVATIATTFITVGGVIAPNLREQLSDLDATLTFIGSLVQVVGLLGALAFSAMSLRARFSTREARTE